jgi:hypothetical protein
MPLTRMDEFRMDFIPYQPYRFIVLNLKLLRAVDHSKRAQQGAGD